MSPWWLLRTTRLTRGWRIEHYGNNFNGRASDKSGIMQPTAVAALPQDRKIGLGAAVLDEGKGAIARIGRDVDDPPGRGLPHDAMWHEPMPATDEPAPDNLMPRKPLNETLYVRMAVVRRGLRPRFSQYDRRVDGPRDDVVEISGGAIGGHRYSITTRVAPDFSAGGIAESG